jgi:hypothetical protein
MEITLVEASWVTAIPAAMVSRKYALITVIRPINNEKRTHGSQL